MSLNSRIADLNRMALDQINRLAFDFREPPAVQKAAQKLVQDALWARLDASIARFEAATPVFTALTRGLLDLSEIARDENRVTVTSDAVTKLAPVIEAVGDVFAEVAEIAPETSPKTQPDAPDPPTRGELNARPAIDLSATAPPPGRAKNSKRFSDLADEYVAVFDAAAMLPAKKRFIDRFAGQIAGFRPEYDKVSARTGVPWHMVGLIHLMESSFNFGRHLHNGDSLAHRTVRVPRGRPRAGVADPPFTWSTSAVDALESHKLDKVSDWSLARQLYELERYNGFGYRFREIASPYLWSFSDRYTGGKYVADGRFDPGAVSKQAGAAVVMKRMIETGAIARPSVNAVASRARSAAVAPTSPAGAGAEPAWLISARKDIGQMEIDGAAENPRIRAYHETTGFPIGGAPDADEIAWCASFVNFHLKQAGVRGKGSARAADWIDWGRKLDAPEIGCVVLLSPGTAGGSSGHVGFYVGESGRHIKLLGGNQKNAVSIAKYAKSRVRRYAMP